MNCFNCIYYKAETEVGQQGQCRRHPPTVMYSAEDDTFLSAFPYISDPNTNYCGDCAVAVEAPRVQTLS